MWADATIDLKYEGHFSMKKRSNILLWIFALSQSLPVQTNYVQKIDINFVVPKILKIVLLFVEHITCLPNRVQIAYTSCNVSFAMLSTISISRHVAQHSRATTTFSGDI